MDGMETNETIRFRADFSEFRREVDAATRMADGMGRAFTRAFEGAVLKGNDFSDVLRGLALRMSDIALRAGLRPLEQGIGDAISGAVAGLTPFAKGGVLGGPAVFPMGRGLGLAGEAGPEAILPLRRGADGRLGVAAGEGGGGVSITFNVSTPDARSFLASESQVHAMLARAAARGRRNL